MFVTLAVLFLNGECSMGGPTWDLHVKQEITNFTVTCFVMGFGLGSVSLFHCDLWHR